MKRTEKFIQFGEGGFLRGFADWMIQKMNDTTNHVLLAKWLQICLLSGTACFNKKYDSLFYPCRGHLSVFDVTSNI